MNWGMVGALAGVLALFEAPSMAAGIGIWRWARRLEERLDHLEDLVANQRSR